MGFASSSFTVMSVAALTGNLQLTPGFAWIGTWPALILFATATVLEIGAYYIPWLDNALDTVATPAAVIAGAVVTTSVVGDISPMLRWVLAIIAGGGVSGSGADRDDAAACRLHGHRRRGQSGDQHGRDRKFVLVVGGDGGVAPAGAGGDYADRVGCAPALAATCPASAVPPG
ncbi:MAG: DUF4126 domain-containing protein [Caldilineaceae bacterium]